MNGLRRKAVVMLIFHVFAFGAARSAMAQDTSAQHVLTIAEAIDLALNQASKFKTAQINEKIAAEDIKQARAAYLPKVAVQPNYIYNSPSLGGGSPRPPSFISANAINEYQGLVMASGELDTSGKLSATLRRNQALLDAARAGSEVARRDLIQAVNDAYFSLELSVAKRRGAETNLAAAQEFENNTKLNVDAGEVAPVDLVRARLQTAARGDELEQAKVEETVNADTLRFLIGYEFTRPVAVTDLLTHTPISGEIERYTETTIGTRPEFTQFEAERRAAEQEIKVARADRRPQLTYSASTGFVSDSLSPVRLKNHLGVQITVGVNIPIFDAGATRSRETQARLKMEQSEIERELAARQFRNDFFAAKAQAESAAVRIKQIGATIADAEQNLNASLARYRAGEAGIIEVTDAQNLLVTQRQALYKAIFDYQTARARLLRAIGQ
ncbi:MAG TPA: TolC family protein [Pyrinomonadaceae bacterium]|nr:TolC family protein [Pyrinomonadaceae bacterium]